MSAVIHILADGTRTTDITGHVVKLDDARQFYEILNNVNRRLANEKRNPDSNKRSFALSE